MSSSNFLKLGVVPGKGLAPASAPASAPAPVNEIVEDFLSAAETARVGVLPWVPGLEKFSGGPDEVVPVAVATTAPVITVSEPTVAPTLPPAADATAPPVEIPEILHGRTAFLSGAAGTGKTYLARGWVNHPDHRGTLLAATTGIASANLGEGTTINALLRYFDTASLRDSYTEGRLTSILAKLHAAGTRRIILDEVSMMDADQLTIITRALDELAGDGYILDERVVDELEDETGSGKKQRTVSLVLAGDYCQLPPVKAEFAFTSPEWERYAGGMHRLQIVRRQADPAFVQAMHAARRGDAAAVCDFFGPHMVAGTDAHFAGTTIFATNDAVSRYNALRLDQLKTPTQLIASTVWGKPRGDWKNIPERLALKVGSLVMLLANQKSLEDERLAYANGDLATVLDIDPERNQVHVRLHRNNLEHVVWRITRNNTIPLEPGRRKALKAAGDDHLIDDKHEIVGQVTYLPMRLAWGTTVHKAQGLSLDNVQINIREGFFSAPAMVYVGLSRARTLAGLRLVGTVDGLRTRVTVNPAVTPWL